MLAGIDREIVTQKMLEEGKMIDSLTTAELMVIINLHGVTKLLDVKVPNSRERWRKIIKEKRLLQIIKSGLSRKWHPWQS